MLFLIAIVVAVLFSWFCAEPLRKHPVPFYIVGTVVSVLMIILNQKHVQTTAFTSTYIIGLFNRGTLAAALWCVVAWIGALPDGAKEIRKRLLPARGELSIFAALITLSHAVVYGISYVKRLFSGRPGETDFILTCIICLILMLIMIPLTIISFKAIRKKMKGKTWKNIQRAAYVFYALIYVHIMVILLPRAHQGREGVMLSILVYTVVFAGYAVFRIRKEIIRKKKPQSTAAMNGVCAAALILVTGIMGISSRATEVPAVTAEKPIPAETTVSTAPAATSVTETKTETETIPASEMKQTPETTSETKTISETETVPETSVPVTSETNPESLPETQAVSETKKSAETSAVSEIIATEAAVQETDAPSIQTEQPAPQEEPPAQEEQNIPQEEQPVQEETPAPEPETEQANTIYNDGTYSVTKFGYDSDVVITVTIENDVITDVTASCQESDMYYFDVAYPVLKSAILAAQSPDVDAVSGSTYSSNAIRDGVREALNQARK